MLDVTPALLRHCGAGTRMGDLCLHCMLHVASELANLRTSLLSQACPEMAEGADISALDCSRRAQGMQSHTFSSPCS